MKLTTIWTLRHMPLRERLRRTREWGCRTVAHRLPRQLAYWTLIDMGARHIKGNEHPDAVRFMEIVKRAEHETPR